MVGVDERSRDPEGENFDFKISSFGVFATHLRVVGDRE
jgi:hypothetical protein